MESESPLPLSDSSSDDDPDAPEPGNDKGFSGTTRRLLPVFFMTLRYEALVPRC